MKRTVSLLSAALVAGLLISGCNNAAPVAATATQADTTAAAGSIVFFNIDKVVENYDMANDLRSVVETKVSGIQSEIDRRGNKLQKDAWPTPSIRSSSSSRANTRSMWCASSRRCRRSSR